MLRHFFDYYVFPSYILLSKGLRRSGASSRPYNIDNKTKKETIMNDTNKAIITGKIIHIYEISRNPARVIVTVSANGDNPKISQRVCRLNT